MMECDCVKLGFALIIGLIAVLFLVWLGYMLYEMQIGESYRRGRRDAIREKGPLHNEEGVRR